MRSSCHILRFRTLFHVLVLSALLFVVLGSVPALAQELSCGSEVTPEIAQRFLERWKGQAPQVKAPPDDFHACIPIAAHIVRRSNGTGGLSISQLEQGIADCNSMYANTGMNFYLMQAIDYIDDDDYYLNITTNAEIDALIQENVVANAVNVYFTENLTVDDGETGLCGRGSFTTSTPQGVAMLNDCTGVASTPSTFPHELGHFFDLFHTHSTGFGNELVDGSNCAIAGDLLCDTPADPRLQSSGDDQNITAGCMYYGTETDGNGDSYNPDTSQLMSYAPKTCRTTMSPMSEAKVVATLTDLRPEMMRCPPEAHAGDDQVVECTSPTTTAATLDGTDSSHPDGLAFTYLWEAAGIVFDDPTSATPTGQFPFGTTTVTLTVSDGELASSDEVDITVVDTTPADVTCPDPITVECTSHDGTPRDDEQFAGWWESASAIDICCEDPSISDDGPAYFELGETTVTFTATDCSGNESSCQVVVTVEDTTPPTIEVALDREVLWPPNHKMSEILATVVVEDICCPNPTFVLTSATSSEPDNGLGDGDTENDIQGADIGTDDVQVLLRSERSGHARDGRVYTLCYQASDCVGNTADACVEVLVPHSQGGSAMQVSGFTVGGSGIALGAKKITLMIQVDKILDLSGDGSGAKGQPVHELNEERIYIGNAAAAAPVRVVSAAGPPVDGVVDYYLMFSVADLELVLASDPLVYGSVGLYYDIGGKKPHRVVGNIFDLSSLAGIENEDLPDLGDGTLSQANSNLPVKPVKLRAAPNPFNPRTEIQFGLEQSGRVAVVVYDIRGQRVVTLMDEVRSAGLGSVIWNGLDHQGRQVATGTYFVRMIAGVRSETIKIALVK